MNIPMSYRMVGAGLSIFVLAGIMAWINYRFQFGMAGQAVAMLVVAVASVTLIRWSTTMARAAGCSTPAVSRYNQRFTLFLILYMAGLFGAVFLHQRQLVDGPIGYLAASLPTVGALGMVWTMMRYPTEEEDEYLRYRFVKSAMFGVGVVLMLGTVWGFLEMFRLVPHIPAWWVLPVFALGMGAGGFIGMRRP